MSTWTIYCPHCKETTKPGNIVKLMCHLDKKGLFVCWHCKRNGYIEKKFDLQEGGNWKPYLKGILKPDWVGERHLYSPFVFLVSDTPESPVKDIWFCYYKDMRKDGGRLKMGHGPGGPPVFNIDDVSSIVERAKEIRGP